MKCLLAALVQSSGFLPGKCSFLSFVVVVWPAPGQLLLSALGIPHVACLAAQERLMVIVSSLCLLLRALNQTLGGSGLCGHYTG
jgi:hypothetical protein